MPQHCGSHTSRDALPPCSHPGRMHCILPKLAAAQLFLHAHFCESCSEYPRGMCSAEHIKAIALYTLNTSMKKPLILVATPDCGWGAALHARPQGCDGLCTRWLRRVLCAPRGRAGTHGPWRIQVRGACMRTHTVLRHTGAYIMPNFTQCLGTMGHAAEGSYHSMQLNGVVRKCACQCPMLAFFGGAQCSAFET